LRAQRREIRRAGFSEALRHELQMANGPVRLSVVHPGGLATNIARNSRTGIG